MMKACSICGIEKELNESNFYRRNLQKLRNECISCVAVRRKANHEKNRGSDNQRSKKHYEENKQECSERQKEYRIINSDKISEKSRKHYLENRVAILDSQKIYNLNNRDSVNKNKRKHHKEKYKTDIAYRLRHDMSARINKVLRKSGGSKLSKSIMDYLGFTMEEFVAHIENQFKEPGNEWMNWGNRGAYTLQWNEDDVSTWRWNVDHIIPQSDLLYDSMEHPNFCKCWALENLRPLSAKQNVLEGTRRTRHREAA